MFKVKFISLTCLLLISGCTGMLSDSGKASVSGTFLRESDPSLKLLESVEDLAKYNVQTTGTSFIIPFKDDHYAWERAQYFLQKFVGKGKPALIKITGDRFTLTNNGNPVGNFSYQVIKDNTKSGFRYGVMCSPRNQDGSRESADFNARNLARFIKDGNLEVSVLER